MAAAASDLSRASETNTHAAAFLQAKSCHAAVAFVCWVFAQEEHKVAVLSQRLEALGVDVAALLASLPPASGGEDAAVDGSHLTGGADDEAALL
jgi:hypothetical protein